MNRINKMFLIFVVLILLSACVSVGVGSNSKNSDDEKLVQEDNQETINDSRGKSKDSINEQNDNNEKAEDKVNEQNDEEKEEAIIKTKSQTILEKMSLKEKIGQLFMVRPEALDLVAQENAQGINHEEGATDGTIQMTDRISQSLKEYPVGGIILFGKNIINPEQTKEFILEFQSKSLYPLFVGVDEEGGMVARIANNPNFNVKKFPNMHEIGDTKDVNIAKNVGLAIGKYLKELGFNITFAPVADINTNPENVVIGERAFGDDPKIVGEMVAAELEGLHQEGLMGCIKHFPGHGDTSEDTHSGYVSIDKSLKELMSCEFIPFFYGIEAKTDMVMVAHITAVNIDKEGLPSTLSYEIVTEVLRNELGYDGVIITDGLEMGAITKNYSSEEMAVKAILAGVDVLLAPENLKEAFDSIYNAVENGTISEERIDTSVLRILQLKEKYKLI